MNDLLQIAGKLVKKRISKFIFSLLLNVVPIILIFLLIVSIPLLLVEEAKAIFNNFIHVSSADYYDGREAVDAWVNSLDDGLTIGEGYLSKNMLKKFISLERKSYFVNKTITVNVVSTDSLNMQRYGALTKPVKYKLMLYNSTKNYILPWQVLAAKNLILMGDTDKKDNNITDTIYDTFVTKYYGLFMDDESTPVTYDSITSSANYRFKKSVKVDTTITTEVEEDPIKIGNNKKIEEDTEQISINIGTESPIPKKIVTKTTHSIEKVEYPLPYFTRIETMFTTYEFEYEYETKTVISSTESGNAKIKKVTTITEPVIKNVDSTLATARYVESLRKMGLVANKDLDYIQAMVVALPNGEGLGGMFDPILNAVANLKAFDVYYGAEDGTGVFKLTGTGILTWPVYAPIRISSGFGMRLHPVTGEYKMHSGIDIPVPMNTSVVAAADGLVERAGAAGTYGNLIILRHESGVKTYYAHLNRVLVEKGDIVGKNQLIAYSGNTGRSTVALTYTLKCVYQGIL